MIALFSLLTIITLSIVVIRIGAIALELTGLPSEVAAFQAQSAFSGTGYTTSEAESVVNHPVRRKIVRVLILLGSAGLTSTIATFILTFIGESNQSITFRFCFLSIGIFIIYLLSRSQSLYRAMKMLILKMLKRYTSLHVIDYQEVFGLSKGYTISKFKVKKNSWMDNKTLEELKLNSEGILIFSIQRKIKNEDKFIGVPTSSTIIKAGDILTCYGQAEAIKGLSTRQKGQQGDKEHEAQIKEEKVLAEVRERQGGYS